MITPIEKVVSAEILSNKEIAPGVFRLVLAVGETYRPPKPGQFVNIYLNDAARLLPRPISVCGYEPGALTVVYAVVGEGTKILSQERAGDTLRVSTPLGNNFQLVMGRNRLDSALLVGGGLGVPPMLHLAAELQKTDCKPRVVLGYRCAAFLADDFEKISIKPEIATDDGSAGIHGTVMDLLKNAPPSPGTVVFACGPKPMLQALASLAAEAGLELYVSMEERMGCGYGACVGCVCKTRHGSKRICTDGPVFDARDIC